MKKAWIELAIADMEEEAARNCRQYEASLARQVRFWREQARAHPEEGQARDELAEVVAELAAFRRLSPPERAAAARAWQEERRPI